MTSVPNWSVNATVPGVFGDEVIPALSSGSSAVLTRPTRAIYVGTAGHVVVRHCGATQLTTYKNAAGGVEHPWQVDMVLAHATTAATGGDLVAMG